MAAELFFSIPNLTTDLWVVLNRATNFESTTILAWNAEKYIFWCLKKDNATTATPATTYASVVL